METFTSWASHLLPLALVRVLFSRIGSASSYLDETARGDRIVPSFPLSLSISVPPDRGGFRVRTEALKGGSAPVVRGRTRWTGRERPVHVYVLCPCSTMRACRTSYLGVRLRAPVRPSSGLRRVSSPAFCRGGDGDLRRRLQLGGKADVEKKSFVEKLGMAFRIFFPKKEVQDARNEAKKRLRMILVADRCSMSPVTLNEMKTTIVGALSNYVVIEDEQGVDLSVSADPNLGTLYSVSVPVRRVKPQYTQEAGFYGGDLDDGISMAWEDEDDSYPMGT